MPTIEEMDAHIAYMDAWLKKCYEDEIASITRNLKVMEHPYVRQKLEKDLEKMNLKLTELEDRRRRRR